MHMYIYIYTHVIYMHRYTHTNYLCMYIPTPNSPLPTHPTTKTSLPTFLESLISSNFVFMYMASPKPMYPNNPSALLKDKASF